MTRRLRARHAWVWAVLVPVVAWVLALAWMAREHRRSSERDSGIVERGRP